MLNRNKIFKTVRDTTNSLNVSTGKKMDNFYTELMTYEDMVQKRYDKIKDILNTIKYHHNKIQNLDKNYTNAIFGGGKTDIAKLMKDIDSAIDSIESLIASDGILITSKFGTLINKKEQAFKEELNLQKDKISKDDVKQENKIFFETAHKELSEVKKEFDENRNYINDLVEKIKKIEDPINQYILDKKLSKDFRQSIKNGIRDLIKLVESDNKDNFDKFNQYKTNITIGLGYAKEAEAENIKYENDPNATDDLKILRQIQRDSNKLEFHTQGNTRGYLKIPGFEGNNIGYKVISSNTAVGNYETSYNQIEFDNTNYIKTLYIGLPKSGGQTRTSITKYYYLDIETVKNLHTKRTLLSNINTIFVAVIDLIKSIKNNLFPNFVNIYTNEDSKEYKIEDFSDSELDPSVLLLKTIINSENKKAYKQALNQLVDKLIFLYSKHFFDKKLDKLLADMSTRAENIEQKLIFLKNKINTDFVNGTDDGEVEERKLVDIEKETIGWIIKFYNNNNDLVENETTTKEAVGGNPEKLKESVINALQIFKKIRKQIEEDYDKEYNSTNKPPEPKTNQPKQNDIVKSAKTMFGVNTQQEDENNKITNSIISSIIENYEKERSSVNTIEDKIKLDTKFVDILDNLGLNLADIFKINFEDKLAFIFFILILHIVVYSVVESLIMNDYLTDIVYIMAVYVGIYFLIMFILILILNKYVNYRMKSVLNYLNTDFNMQLITMHLFIVFMFYIIVLILSQHIDIFVAKEEDDKLQILYRIEVISSIIFIFSSVFVMLL